MAASSRHLAAIMFTDMVGYSALVQRDESTALDLLRRHNGLLRPIFSQYHGREVKTVGDAFLVEFDSALDAAQCAVEIQRLLHEHNLSSPKEIPIRIRIGIHVGDVVRSEGDVLGDAVNIASRIEPLADPEGVCLTQQVYDQIQNKIPTSFTKLPPTALKNIHVPVTVYRAVLPWESVPGRRPGPKPGGGRQLAVLPLTNISPDPNDSYFADGLTEELIAVLSQVRDLSVIARTSVTPYKTAPKSIAQVGAELNVDTVLEGSVRRAGNRIRITLQLIDVSTQQHIWANSYNREVDDVFAVQADIAERTAEALRLELSRSEQAELQRRPTENPEAYDLYLRGLVAGSDLNEASLAEAVRCFERATTLDPEFAEAYAAWANQYVVAAGDYVSMREVIPKARQLVARALELDPQSSQAHAALANILMQFDNDWERAEAEFRQAIKLNPNNVDAYRFLALLLIAHERFEEAKELLRITIQLDPAGRHRDTLAWAELESGNYDAALAVPRDLLGIDPSSPSGHVYLGLFYIAAGRKKEAATEAEYPVPSDDETTRFDHALLSALLDHPEEARTAIAAIERGEAKSYTSASHLAMLYSVVGDKQKALDLLERDDREGDRVLWLFYRGVFFDPIRADPRFIALLRSRGLPTSPITRGDPSRDSPRA